MKHGISMTREQAEAHQRKHGFATDALSSSTEQPVARPKPLRGPKQPNKTEATFGLWLEKMYATKPVFEGVKLRIGGNCYYTPDWCIFRPMDPIHLTIGRPILFEVKGGHIWDDSKVKFKAAVEWHTWAEFQMWQLKKSQWNRIM